MAEGGTNTVGNNTVEAAQKLEERSKMFKIIRGVEDKGCTLVIASVGIGNVAQLAMDLILETLKPMKIAYIWHPAVPAVVGDALFDTEGKGGPELTTAAEVFYDANIRMFFVQLRAPTVREHVNLFLRELLNWAKEVEMKKIVILTSNCGTERIDSQLEGEPFRYLASPNLKVSDEDKFRSLNWKMLEHRQNRSLARGEPLTSDVSKKYHLPGGGFARKFYFMCVKDGFSTALLTSFCSEGDNRPDACYLANKLNQWLKIVSDDVSDSSLWTVPASWDKGFGNDPPVSLY